MEPDERAKLLSVADEIDRDDSPDFLSIVRQLLVAVGGDPDEIVQTADASVRRLKEQHAGFCSDATPEKARRCLQNARLLTPFPDERIAGLTAKKLNLHEDLSKLLGKLVPVAVQLAYVEAELVEVLKVRDAIREGRKARAETKLYSDTLKFVDDLFDEYGVTHANFAAMTPSERHAIAKILHRQK